MLDACQGSAPSGGAAAGSVSSAQANPDRILSVVNNSQETIWIGAAGGSTVPACVIPGGQTCLASPSLTSNGMCACSASQPQNGTLVCPSGSTPSADGKFCTCDPSSANACGGSGATTACSVSADPQRCFWVMPEPSQSGSSASNPWQLDPSKTATFTLPQPTQWSTGSTSADSPVWWSGGMFARTGCRPDGTQCATADCSAPANQSCPAGQGGSNPFSQAEFTLQVAADDFYDITIINGANLSVEMAPAAKQQLASAGSNDDPKYWCSNPGGATSSTGLGGCSWDFDPIVQGVDQTALLLNSSLPCSTANPPSGCPSGYTCSGAPGGCFLSCSSDNDCPGSLSCQEGFCQCDDDSDCASGQSCGSQFVPGITRAVLQQCGSFAGWWTADDFCALVSKYGPLDCTKSIQDGNQTSNTTLQNLFACTGNNASSCYNSDAQAGICCGCATDTSNPLSSKWPPAATGDQCFSNDSTWAAQAQPWLAYLKDGCPTAYTYPFDDATSTFKCNTQASPNQVNYTITFGGLPTPQ